jgi:hypothetical protein
MEDLKNKKEKQQGNTGGVPAKVPPMPLSEIFYENNQQVDISVLASILRTLCLSVLRFI